ncbi:hypothetical protein T484DRAFT_1755740 [Baffinella frigidus]|nr:hypothetical protein T484DRAFT_1755740 [Cryptophyta sp. CCMP2293]
MPTMQQVIDTLEQKAMCPVPKSTPPNHPFRGRPCASDAEDDAETASVDGGGKISINSKEAVIIVKDFVLLKSFDVVSSGQYRKFVLRKKDLCDQWAMTMHDNYHIMILEIRNLSKYAMLAKSQGHMEVAIVCTKLLNCNECPFEETSGWNTCTITKVQCMGGVRVNSASESTPVVVHPRFLRFCLSFWYTSRFEHVLRRVVRGKYTKTYCDQYTLSEVSATIHADTEIVGAAVDNFLHATNPLRAPFVNRPPSAPIDTLAPQQGLQESERRDHRNIANEPGLTNRARDEELTSGAPHLSASVKNHRG